MYKSRYLQYLFGVACHFFGTFQSGGSDCGLFAIANAIAVAFGRLPHTLHYDQMRMRGHLYRCLKKGRMTLFPHKTIVNPTSPVTQKEDLPIFCICRMPEQGEMVECSNCQEWFHVSCEVIPKKAIEESKVEWLCSNCTNT